MHECIKTNSFSAESKKRIYVSLDLVDGEEETGFPGAVPEVVLIVSRTVAEVHEVVELVGLGHHHSLVALLRLLGDVNRVGLHVAVGCRRARAPVGTRLELLTHVLAVNCRVL